MYHRCAIASRPTSINIAGGKRKPGLKDSRLPFLKRADFSFFLIKRSVLCHSLLLGTMNVEMLFSIVRNVICGSKVTSSFKDVLPISMGGPRVSNWEWLPIRDRYLALTSWWLLWLLWFKYLIKKDNLLSWALLDINQYQCKPNQILDRPLVCALFCCSWGLIVLECTFSSASFSHICSQSMPLMKVARERWWYQH